MLKLVLLHIVLVKRKSSYNIDLLFPKPPGRYIQNEFKRRRLLDTYYHSLLKDLLQGFKRTQPPPLYYMFSFLREKYREVGYGVNNDPPNF